MIGGFSFNSLFYNFDIDIVAYLAIFLILFAMITWILRKTKLFADSKGIMIVISISSALLALYGLIRANFSISDLMFRFNIPGLLQQNLIWMLFLVVFLIFWIKFGFGICLMLIGAGLFVIGALGLVYANTGFMIVGGILFILGYLWWRWRKHINKYKELNLNDQLDYKLKKRALEGDKRRDRIPQNIGFLGTSKDPQKAARARRNRSAKELQKKYDFYSKKVRKIQKKNNGKIPKLNSGEGHLRHRYIQAMKAIENDAKRQGFKLR
jgi:hypothetical protein